MPNSKSRISKRPKIFSPSVTRNEVDSHGFVSDLSLKKMVDSNIENTSSFRYDAPGTGLRSTQEIDIDYSKFENHTFFNSAESKVNIAFDRIINEFPFDGTRDELEKFEDSLTGFEKDVLKRFPKNVGFLMFSASHVEVVDSAGSQFPNFSKINTGDAVLDVDMSSFSIEAHVYPARTGSDNQVICQKLSGSTGGDGSFGFLLALSASNLDRAGNDGTSAGGSASSDLIFAVSSGSLRLATSASIDKGKWNHICAVFDRSVNRGRLMIYVSQSLVASSSNVALPGRLLTNQSSLTIGSGSAQNIQTGYLPGEEKTIFTPQQTFSGAIDEFRFFHNVRTPESQGLYGTRNIFSDNDLKLYFKLNEPYYTGTYGINNVCIDSSGNSLHSSITNFTASLRLTGSLTNPMTAEDKNISPILFPEYSKVANLNSTLLSSASNYDSENPNLITRLIPKHHLLEGQVDEGMDNEDGQIGEPYLGKSIPGSGQIGSAQLLTSFLLIWAKFFDELKVFIDHFSSVIHTDYDSADSVTDKFLPFVAKYYGFHLPSIYSNTPLEQFSRGENIKTNQSLSSESLSYIQNQIWKRILINIKDIAQSKGTIHSVKSIMRAAGINPDKVFSIREYGGPKRFSLKNRRQKTSDVSSMIDFSGSFSWSPKHEILDLSQQGFGSSTGSFITPHLVSGFLSSSRIEAGFPEPKGTMLDINDDAGKFLHGISNEPGDGFFTSGSFTYEAIYKFPIKNEYPVTQSLIRIHTTGSTSPASGSGLVLSNLIVLSGAQNNVTSSGSGLKLFVRPSIGSTNEPVFTLSLTGVNIFDGNQWSVSFGRNRCDEIGAASSSSYFLRCGRQSFGKAKEYFSTSSFFQETSVGTPASNLFQAHGSSYNSSGPFLVVGSQSISQDTTNNYCLNVGVNSGIENLNTEFAGKVGHIRFWSKGLSDADWREHVRNFKSLGVSDPMSNFNFMTEPTGAFGRLRLDCSTDQAVTNSNGSGDIALVDFSQNSINFSASGFETNKSVIRPETFYYSMLSPSFDVGQSDEKVRVRGYSDVSYLDDNSYATTSPVFDVTPSEIPDDDTRFTIDYSAMKALNEDIMSLFSSLEFFDNALGKPNLLFDETYPDLDYMREVYFNRLEKKLNVQAFFDFFKWFDTALGSLIEQVIPRKTKFMGINFVIESHVLERHRFRYLFDEIYLQGFERDVDARGVRVEDDVLEALLNAE